VAFTGLGNRKELVDGLLQQAAILNHVITILREGQPESPDAERKSIT